MPLWVQSSSRGWPGTSHFGTSKLLLNILAIWTVPAAVVLLDISWNLKLIWRLKFLKSGESQFSLPLSSNQTRNWIQMYHKPPTLGKLKWTKTYCIKISGALIYWWSWQSLVLDSLIWILSLCGPLNTYSFACMISGELCTAEQVKKGEKLVSPPLVSQAEAELSTVVWLTSVSIQADWGIDLYSLQRSIELKIGTLVTGCCCLSSLVTTKNRIFIQDQCNIGSCSLIYANIFDFMQMYNWPFFGPTKLAGTRFWALVQKKMKVVWVTQWRFLQRTNISSYLQQRLHDRTFC